MRFDGVWFRYGRRADWTLREVTRGIEAGQTVVVLGRNGAGKSTLLQLAAGVLRPSRGSVRGRPPVVGWVPERFPADQPFTARDYLHRMASLRGRTAAEADKWIERLLLTEHSGTRLSDLSKGTAQKVGLAQALIARPGLLILDEPWEGLDSVARTLIPEIVAEVTADGGMVLVSDHRGEVEGLADAAYWQVSDAAVTVVPLTEDAVVPAPPDEVIIEVKVRRAESPQVVAKLKAEGHQILEVRGVAAAQPQQIRSGPGLTITPGVSIGRQAGGGS
ncbi:ATP-binding cassette domain-containing protein [Paractinoplanes hotanensis]|uniref:ABC transporter ATP-binding protein n=1 Tax=Paractinoplanes hotanensis TaxID=2906497 RepID=A0ABT0Y8S4_9ACTN|nr:ABC transporter ATP-binding protein [Actinoplanes hotanensis]MCM4081903.1 ABC transporter ATP-binding protein [Actinoplanes hotanensis]